MKKIIFILVMAMTLAGQAFAFNPDPTRYEYIGQKKLDDAYYFYEIASARADGQKGVLMLLQADPKNRTLRYYRNTVIDPDAMTIRATYCELRDYYGNVLETFNLPPEGVKYQKGDLTDKIYQDLLNKGIVRKPVVSGSGQGTGSGSGQGTGQIPPPEPDWTAGLPGGEEQVQDWTAGLP
jgi:hypothetical protein